MDWLLLFFSFSLWAAPPKKITPTPKNESDRISVEQVGHSSESETAIEKPIFEKQSLIETADELQMKGTSQIFNLSDELDSFFGEKRADDVANHSTLRIVPSYYQSETGATNTITDVRLNLRLRNLEDWTERTQNSIVDFVSPPTEKDKAAIQSSDRPNSPGAIRREALKLWNVNWENRLGYSNKIDVYSILRSRRTFPGLFFQHYFYQEVGWSNVNQWQAVTSLTSDTPVDTFLLFRFVNEFHWAMTDRIFSTVHGPSLIHSINTRNSLSYDARFSSLLVGHAWYGDAYNVGVNYRHQFSNKWLYMDISPQASFIRLNNFKRDLNITIRFEAVMGDN